MKIIQLHEITYDLEHIPHIKGIIPLCIDLIMSTVAFDEGLYSNFPLSEDDKKAKGLNPDSIIDYPSIVLVKDFYHPESKLRLYLVA